MRTRTVASVGALIVLSLLLGACDVDRLARPVQEQAEDDRSGVLGAGEDDDPSAGEGGPVSDGAGAGGEVESPSVVSASERGPVPGATSGMPGVRVSPGDDLQDMIDANPPGTTFILQSGEHRGVSVRPRDGDVFVGAAGAVLNGSTPLTSFSRVSDAWVVSGQRQQAPASGRCEPGSFCQHPENVFVDDQMLRQVASRAQLRPGTWYFDYGADKVYVYDDPRGRSVEISTLPWAFTADGGVDDVTIRNLVVEKYAVPGGRGAINALGGSDWTVQDNEVRLNHCAGVRAGDGSRIMGNYIHHNGRFGLTTYDSDDIVVEDNEVSHNNLKGFDQSWGAGGSKFVQTDGLTLRNNYVHRNLGTGLWVDINNINTLYEGNVVVDNERHGIFHEISYAAEIRRNVASGNGEQGIFIAHSRDVEVYDNTVEFNGKRGVYAYYNPSRGSGLYGSYQVRNLDVHDNKITMKSGFTGIGAPRNAGTSVWTSWNNRFHGNTYKVATDDEHYQWGGDNLTAAQWRAAGQDRDGTWLEIPD